MPGPVGKRDAERRRRNKDAVPTETVDIAELVGRDVEVPVANEDWHPTAKMWYESLKSSGQAIFYEPSDWAMAYLLAETIDRELKPREIKVGERDVIDLDDQEDEEGRTRTVGKDYIFEEKIVPIQGSSLTALLKGMTALMVAEGDRRRLKIELERQKAKNAAAGGGSNVVPITQQRQQRFKREAQK